MALPFIAEIRMFSCATIPRGWAACEGQLLPINQNQALFALLGTTYGGDGIQSVQLPDMRGRAAQGTAANLEQGAPGTALAPGAGTEGRLAIQFCIALQGIFPTRN
jgi:microcystin-dependent protein